MKRIPVTLYFVLGLTFFLRIFRVDDLLYFFMDEAIIAFRGWGLFALKRPFLIGGISPLGLHHPPYFYWFSALFLPLTGFDPIVWGWLAALIGTLTVFCLFLLAREIGNTRLGLVAAFVYSTSFTAIFFDRHYWPLVFNPLMTIMTLYLLIKEDFPIRWLFLALILVFAVTCDPSNLSLFLLVGYSYLKNQNQNKSFLLLLTFVVLFATPLFLFDLRHQGSNIQGVSHFLSQIQNLQLNKENLFNAFLLPARTMAIFWITPLIDISQLHTYCQQFIFQRQIIQPVGWPFLAMLFLIIYYFRKRKQLESGENYIASLMLIYFSGLLFYGGLLGKPVFEHYLSGLLPVFAIITARIFVKFWPLGFFLVVIVVAVNLSRFFQAKNPYGLAVSRQAVAWVGKNIGKEDFAFDTVSKCFRYNGIRYLFEISNNSPALSFIDTEFFWLYRQRPAKEFPTKVVVFTDKEIEFKLPIVKNKSFGAWKVYILDNSKRSYEIEF